MNLLAFCMMLLGCACVDNSSAHQLIDSSKDVQKNVRRREQSFLTPIMLATSSDDSHKMLDLNTASGSTTNKNNLCNITFKDTTMALCYYEQGNQNFGDQLGPVISKKLLTNYFNGCSANNLPMYNLNGADKYKFDKCPTCLHTVGSIVHFTNPGDHMFGTGINPNHQKRSRAIDGTVRYEVVSDLHIHATRGPLTWEIIEESEPATVTDFDRVLLKNQILSNDNMVYGDGGFLTVTLFPEFSRIRSIVSPNLPIQYCIIPHSNDLKEPEVNELLESLASVSNADNGYKVIIISTHHDWEDQFRLMQTECSYVAASSLHGLIIADSMGIPTLWFQLENSTTTYTEGPFKYNDYYSGIGYNDMKPVTVLNSSILMSSESYFGPIPKQIREKYSNTMIPAFPYHLFETLL